VDEERYQQLVRATGSLQEWLSPLTFADLSRSAATSLIAEHAMAWARWHGFVVRTEVEAIASRLRPRDHRIGALAIAGEHPAGRQLAIEIDPVNRIWSIEKLAAEADAGKFAFWIKWGAPVTLSLVPGEGRRRRTVRHLNQPCRPPDLQPPALVRVRAVPADHGWRLQSYTLCGVDERYRFDDRSYDTLAAAGSGGKTCSTSCGPVHECATTSEPCSASPRRRPTDVGWPSRASKKTTTSTSSWAPENSTTPNRPPSGR